MSTTKVGANAAVATSALVVAGVWGYRKFTATTTGQPAPATAPFVTGFFFVYVFLGITADVAPPIAAGFAWLIAVGDLLTNGQALIKGLNTTLHATTVATAPAGTSTTASTGASSTGKGG